MLENSIEIYSSPTNTTETEVKVYKAILELNNFLAIKVIKGYESRNSLSELKILKDLSGKKQCFLQILGDHILEKSLYIITEYIENTLEKEIEKRKPQNNPFSNDETDEIIIKLLEGFALMQSKKIYHRDIKPQNILIENRNIKIIDFSVSLILDPESNTINQYTPQGSPDYVAPEIKDALMERIYDKDKQVIIEYDIEKADVFSLGLMIFQIITLQDIVGLNSYGCEENRTKLVQEIEGWKKNLLAGMLCGNPNERLTLKNALSFIPSKSTVIS
jgi:serine/threonine protein kinase